MECVHNQTHASTTTHARHEEASSEEAQNSHTNKEVTSEEVPKEGAPLEEAAEEEAPKMTVSTLPLPPGKRCNPPSPPPPLRAENPEGGEWRKAGGKALASALEASILRRRIMRLAVRGGEAVGNKRIDHGVVVIAVVIAQSDGGVGGFVQTPTTKFRKWARSRSSRISSPRRERSPSANAASPGNYSPSSAADAQAAAEAFALIDEM